MNARTIPWAEGRWTHLPVAAVEHGSDLLVTAVDGSDAWRTTSYQTWSHKRALSSARRHVRGSPSRSTLDGPPRRTRPCAEWQLEHNLAC